MFTKKTYFLGNVCAVTVGTKWFLVQPSFLSTERVDLFAQIASNNWPAAFTTLPWNRLLSLQQRKCQPRPTETDKCFPFHHSRSFAVCGHSQRLTNINRTGILNLVFTNIPLQEWSAHFKRHKQTYSNLYFAVGRWKRTFTIKCRSGGAVVHSVRLTPDKPRFNSLDELP